MKYHVFTLFYNIYRFEIHRSLTSYIHTMTLILSRNCQPKISTITVLLNGSPMSSRYTDQSGNIMPHISSNKHLTNQQPEESIEAQPIALEDTPVTIVTTPAASLPESNADQSQTLIGVIETTTSLTSLPSIDPTSLHPQLDDSILAYIDQSLRKIKEVGYFSPPVPTTALTPPIHGADRHSHHHGSYNELHELYDMQRRSPYYDSSMDRVMCDQSSFGLFQKLHITFHCIGFAISDSPQFVTFAS